MTAARAETERAPSTPAPLFTRSFILAVISAHCFFITYNMAIAEVPRSLSGEAPWVVGIVVGAMGVAGTLARPLVGVWLESGNRPDRKSTRLNSSH